MVLLLVSGAGTSASAQDWNDIRSLELVRRAVERRARQLADTALADYRAVARGHLLFLAQFGDGEAGPPKVVRADELALEVHWQAPDRSRQFVVGRRDTLLLPTDIAYHRDHLGIVQNNFPDIIRLGDGDEVRDVPHPLSGYGLAAYDFAIVDSLTIRLGARALEVFQVQVRPKDDRAPRAVGAVFLDRTDATVVRMAFSFTRAALKDRQLEDVAIVLENGLVDARFWLPRRQQIEIRRASTWLDYPVRGIIRGTWDIGDVTVNVRPDASLFAGPDEIVFRPPPGGRPFRFEGRLLDALPPDAATVADADIREVQERARALVRAQALTRADPPVLAADRISELVRVNRAEGLALGAALSRQFGAGWYGRLAGRVGTHDGRAKGRLGMTWRGASGAAIGLEASDDLEDVSLAAERSGLANSLAAQEFGSDASEPVRMTGARLRWQWPTVGRAWRVGGAAGWLRHRPALEAGQPLASPARGTSRALLPVAPLDAAGLELDLRRPVAPGWLATQGSAELRVGGWRLDRQTAAPGDAGTVGTIRGDLTVEHAVGRQRVVARTIAGAVGGDGAVPAQFAVLLGGPVSAPGYGLHGLLGSAGVSQRLEWRVPVPFPRIPLGRYGDVRGATLAPYVVGAYVHHGRGLAGWGATAGQPAGLAQQAGFAPSVGVGLLTLFDVLRVDLARGLRNGTWMLGVDVTPALWRAL